MRTLRSATLVLACAVTPAGARCYDQKSEADEARSLAVWVKNQAVVKQEDASAVRLAAVASGAIASNAYIDNEARMTAQQKQQYQGCVAMAQDRLNQGDLHMAAHVSRMAMGNNRLALGDDHYNADPPNYPIAFYCYFTASEGSAAGAYQHYDFAFNDASSAMWCYMEAIGYYGQAQAACLP